MPKQVSAATGHILLVYCCFFGIETGEPPKQTNMCTYKVTPETQLKSFRLQLMTRKLAATNSSTLTLQPVSGGALL